MTERYEKHKVSNDALDTLGMIIGPDEKRDAIHLAVEPVIAAHTLRPGEHVGFIISGLSGDRVGACDDPVGIVDPFLTEPVREGQRFWLVVYPRQITSLRHVWAHPKFPVIEDADRAVATALALLPQAPQKTNSLSKQWIRDFAEGVGISYDTLMQGADDWLASKQNGDWGDYLNLGGLLEGESVPDEFWTHYESVTGRTIDPDHRQSFFACSC